MASTQEGDATSIIDTLATTNADVEATPNAAPATTEDSPPDAGEETAKDSIVDDVETQASTENDAGDATATSQAPFYSPTDTISEEYNRNTGTSEALRDIRKDAKGEDDSENPISGVALRREEKRAPLRLHIDEEKKEDHHAVPKGTETDINFDDCATGEEEPAPTQYQRHKTKFCGALILGLIAILLALIIFLVRFEESSSDSSVDRNTNGGGTVDALESEDEPTPTTPLDTTLFPTTPFDATLFPTSPNPTVTPGTPTMAPTTGMPTRRPTATPSRSPSVAPTSIPSTTPTTSPPTMAPTKRPTPTPTINFERPLKEYLENDFEIDTESDNGKQVIDLMLEEAKADSGNGSLELTPKLAQRFALLAMDLVLFGSRDNIFVGDFFKPNRRILQLDSRWGAFNQDECFWRGVTCDDDKKVTHIKLGDRDLGGSIPTEIGLLSSLVHLDVSDNRLKGTLPEELYNCINLQEIFLYKNRLSGTISNSIRNIWGLTHFNLASNRLTGKIPPNMRSGDKGIFRIRYFNVYDNQMTGTIPANLKLRRMSYFDLGRNQFSGTLPAELGLDYVRVRHLHLDHNRFSGTVPESIINAGQGRLLTLSLNDNQLTGNLPGNHILITEMNQFTVQNNQFTSMGDRTCRLNVLETGEMPEFKSDCDICVCGKNNQMCINCYN